MYRHDAHAATIPVLHVVPGTAILYVSSEVVNLAWMMIDYSCVSFLLDPNPALEQSSVFSIANLLKGYAHLQ